MSNDSLREGIEAKSQKPLSTIEQQNSMRYPAADSPSPSMLLTENSTEREFRKADYIRGGGRSSEADLVLYETERYDRPEEEYTLVRKERIEEADLEMDQRRQGSGGGSTKRGHKRDENDYRKVGSY